MSLLDGISKLAKQVIKPAPPPPPPPPPPPVEAPPAMAKDKAAAGARSSTADAAKRDLGDMPFKKEPQPVATVNAEVGVTVTEVATVEDRETAAVVQDMIEGALGAFGALGGSAGPNRAERVAQAQRDAGWSDAQIAKWNEHVVPKLAADKSTVADADYAAEQAILDGKISPKTAEQFIELATQKLASQLREHEPPVTNAQLVAETMRQVANPGTIQMSSGYGTCTEATAERKFAQESPTAYVKFIADMTSHDRTAHLPGGAALSQNTHQLDSAFTDGRSVTSTLFQQTLHAGFKQGYAEDPLNRGEFKTMWQQVFPEDKGNFVTIAPEHRAEALNHIEAGSVVAIQTPDNDTAHAVSVTAVDREKGTVTFVDPHGQQVENVSFQEFQDRMRGAILPDGTVPDSGESLDVGGGWGSNYTWGGGAYTKKGW